MGWFDEQIRLRKLNDEELFEDSFLDMAGAVMGRELQASLESHRVKTKNAIDSILRNFHLRTREIPEEVTDLDEQLDYLLDPHGIMRRIVYLPSGWYKDAAGPMLLIYKKDSIPVAVLPGPLGGYEFTDPQTQKKCRINDKTQNLFEDKGICFYKPFPLKKLGMKDLLLYMTLSRSVTDHALIFITGAIITAIGALTPLFTTLAHGKVLGSGQLPMLYGLTFFMISAAIGNILFSAVSNMITQAVQIKQSVAIEAAVMMRVLSLPASFFRKFSAGELHSRTQSITELCKQLSSAVLSTGLTSVFSLVYITQIFHYTPALVVPSLAITLITVVFSIVSTLINIGVAKSSMQLAAQEDGMNYAMITGIQKIKLAGAEKRAFARWGRLFAQKAEFLYNPPTIIKMNSVISAAISLIGTIVLYSAAIGSGVTYDNYVAFMSSYGFISGAFLEISSTALLFAGIKPTLDMVKPILEEVPETAGNKQTVTSLGGGIELNHVCFRYSDGMPDILDDLSLKIRPGEYVAIVGETGCGKSTLIRILLGFEKPRKGAVFYDGKDISSLDLRSLRKHIGVVVQNGKLMMGSIYENITISAPWLGMDAAWEAAEAAGLAQDIREMPMGMQTMISEGQGGISGGQKQRLLIARAIAPKPKVLMFDEATSALDNLTQKRVTEAISSYNCTRIVIAHRLSTIQSCDRILLLKDGKITEDGTYDELIALGGFFAELVERQRLDTGTAGQGTKTGGETPDEALLPERSGDETPVEDAAYNEAPVEAACDGAPVEAEGGAYLPEEAPADGEDDGPVG